MIIYTAIQPTGNITLGNYIGSLKNFKNKVKDADQAYLSVADLHSITIVQDPQVLSENIKQLLCIFFALEFEKEATIFVQSHIPAHTELLWPLVTMTKMGELERMTQFKDKSRKQENCNAGLFAYPVLMASDILLYNTTHVPVGVDQKQHLELCRDLAQRANQIYNQELFVVPEPIIEERGAKIFSLTDPTKKMSKSDENEKSFITLFDSPQQVEKKIKSATTDSVGKINYDLETQPGVSNLLVIYAELTNKTMDETLSFFKGQNYGFLKTTLIETINEFLKPIQEKVSYYYNNFDIIEKYLEEHEQTVNTISKKKVEEVYQVMGLRGE